MTYSRTVPIQEAWCLQSANSSTSNPSSPLPQASRRVPSRSVHRLHSLEPRQLLEGEAMSEFAGGSEKILAAWVFMYGHDLPPNLLDFT
jgi:hypothetical protein